MAGWGPAVPGPILPHAIAPSEMAPIGSVPGHGHPCYGLAPGPMRLSCERALAEVTGDGISFGEPRGFAAGLCSPAGCIARGWGTVLANLLSAGFAQQQVLAVGFVPAWTTSGLAQARLHGRNAPVGQNLLPVFSGVFWQRVPVSQSLGIICLGEEIPAPGQGPGWGTSLEQGPWHQGP